MKVFCSYSHTDSHYREELQKRLRRQKLLEIWHDRKILPGERWKQEIDSNLEKADIVLLLVTENFLASRYCRNKELRGALRLAKTRGRPRVIPIILEQCNWQASLIGELQALPRSSEPITSHSDRAKAWRGVVAELSALAEQQLRTRRPLTVAKPSRSRVNRRRDSGVASHILIEKKPPFSEALRAKLAARANFNITSDYFQESGNSFNKLHYKDGLRRFLEDPDAKWLLTVYPEERRCRIETSDERDLITTLEERGKFMVCFESGLHLMQLSEAIVVLETDQEAATEDLLLHLCDETLPGKEEIHFVTLFGPKGHSIVDRRCNIQLEFLTRSLLQQWGSRAGARAFGRHISNLPWERLLGFARSSKPVHVSSLPSNSWSRRKARMSVEASWPSLDLENDDVHTCFLCANDDVAMGVMEAIESRGCSAATLNVSFYGFDGIPEMTQCLSAGVRGCTMKVQFGDMIDRLAAIMKSGSTREGLGPFQAIRFPEF